MKALSVGALGACALVPLLAGATPSPPQLPEDPAGRRAIRGAPIDQPLESEELRALRRFEEESFPREPVYAPLPPGDEGAPPALPPPRPSAESPPEALRSPEEVRAPPEETAPALPWLSQLILPDLPVRLDPRTVRYLEFYKSDKRGRSIMASWLRKQGRFRPLIEEALARYRLPRALLYVAMIESGYDPLDRSSAGAAGLWQFMPEGGRIYGLRIDHWIDERKDPEKATEAVMHYLGDLRARFGSWHLALAAFNAGYGAVLRAVAKYNTNDYWELARHEDGLPWETTLYVPKALAAAVVGENRGLFGYGDVAPEPPAAFDRVSVPTSTSFAAIAKACGASPEEIARLNPELKRGRTPPEPWRARVPKGAGVRFAAAFDKAREHVQPYVVRFGDRLDLLAQHYGSTARELRKWNGIDDVGELRPGLTIVVPEGRAPSPPPVEDQVQVVAVPDKALQVAGRKRVFYRTLPSDDLKDVAAFFKVQPGELSKWNNLDGEARLTSQMVLQLFVAPDFDVTRAALLDPARVRVVTVGSDEFFDLVEARNGRKRLSYTVKAGDTLKRIGARFKLTEADLERINRFSRASELKAGQKVTVYVTMAPKERAEAERRLLADSQGGAANPKREQAPPKQAAEEDDDAPTPAHELKVGKDEGGGDDGGGHALPHLPRELIEREERGR